MRVSTPTDGKGAAKSTVSGPRRGPAGNGGDPAAEKMQGMQALAKAFPHNPNKPAEIGEAARTPKSGVAAESSDPRVTGSTLTEATTSAKTGAPAREGVTPGAEPLERVRIDCGGQPLTTNFGQPIADNQNSLKAGLRGPALLEDFILREKLTHLDQSGFPSGVSSIRVIVAAPIAKVVIRLPRLRHLSCARDSPQAFHGSPASRNYLPGHQPASSPELAPHATLA
jgi:catalase